MYLRGFNHECCKGFMMKIWNFQTLPELYYNEEGYFIIRTKSKSDKDAILMRGPYTIFKKPMFIHEWNADFKFKEDAIRTIPIWVLLPPTTSNVLGKK